MGQPFTLSAKTLPLQVTSVSPNQAGNSGTTTVTIQGAEFTAGTTVSLVPHGGGTAHRRDRQVTFQGSTTLFAQFDLAGQRGGELRRRCHERRAERDRSVVVHRDQHRPRRATSRIT